MLVTRRHRRAKDDLNLSANETFHPVFVLFLSCCAGTNSSYLRRETCSETGSFYRYILVKFNSCFRHMNDLHLVESDVFFIVGRYLL